MWYKVVYNRLAILLLPTFLRKTILMAYVQCLFTPIDAVYYSWIEKRDFDWYRLNHTGQVCKLRKVLNDSLDPSLRRIYIGLGTSFPQEYIYTELETDATWLDDTFFVYTEDEYENTGVDFTVFVPISIIESNIFQLKDLLKFYKLAGKRYKIEPI